VSMVFATTLAPGRYSQGTYSMNVIVSDAYGNSATRTVSVPAPGLVVATVPPPVPNTLLFLHERIPCGSDATQGLPAAFASGGAGAGAPNARIVVLSSDDLQTFGVVGSALADGAGAVARFPLDRPGDRPAVFVTVLDGAGNASLSASGVAG